MGNKYFSIRLIDHLRLAEDEARETRRIKRESRATKGKARGLCREGHDLTNPANVILAATGRKRCKLCKQVSDHNASLVKEARAKLSEAHARERRKKEENT